MVFLSRRNLSLGIALWVLAIAFTGCHFERRVPNGNARDDSAVQSLGTAFYRALAAHDTTALNENTFGAATVLVAAGTAAPSLIALKALNAIPERRTAAAGVRVVRTEVRLDGDLATVRAIVVSPDPGNGQEYEASDLLTLARREGSWRLAHVLFGPWRLRTAP